ncbi:MAG TPA: GNAT family N-acetyltransferase [Nitrospiria bacterium]|nr:GNAT family N-acetyltransferase [Nitrospiria bacterium]
MNLRIRDAREDDRDAIRNVTLAAFQEYATVMHAHWEGYRKAILNTLADVKPAEPIVAEQDGAVVGAVLLYPHGAVFSRPDGSHVTLEYPEARLLAVAPMARGRGIGEALLRECIRRAHRSGAAALTLHTSAFMKAGKRMYERIGFVRAPELDFHPSKDLTVMGYRLKLDDNPPAGPPPPLP